MNADLKGPWLEALRSGDYLQVQGKLCDYNYDDPDRESGYCCLGVLCETNGWEYNPNQGGIVEGPVELVGYEDVELGDTEGLSGLTWDERNSLANMNDAGKNFGEIADWIEENL